MGTTHSKHAKNLETYHFSAVRWIGGSRTCTCFLSHRHGIGEHQGPPY
jgi:hypothetical protein